MNRTLYCWHSGQIYSERSPPMKQSYLKRMLSRLIWTKFSILLMKAPSCPPPRPPRSSQTGWRWLSWIETKHLKPWPALKLPGPVSCWHGRPFSSRVRRVEVFLEGWTHLISKCVPDKLFPNVCSKLLYFLSLIILRISLLPVAQFELTVLCCSLILLMCLKKIGYV